jgi:hypothetical protein
MQSTRPHARKGDEKNMRTIRRIVIAIAAVGLGIVGLQIDGALASSAGSSPGTAASEPLTNYATPTGPELSLDTVQQLASKYAQQAGDSSPSEISAVHTTFAAAQNNLEAGNTAENGAGSANGELAEWEKSSAYLVILRGDFVVNLPVPKGRSLPRGSVYGLILDAHTGFPEGRYVANTTPNLAALGPVTTLVGQ